MVNLSTLLCYDFDFYIYQNTITADISKAFLHLLFVTLILLLLFFIQCVHYTSL